MTTGHGQVPEHPSHRVTSAAADPVVNADWLTVIAYDQQAVLEILRDWTPHQVLQQIETGQFDDLLPDTERAEVGLLLDAWNKRALGMLTLRDVLLIDEQRGQQFYHLLCHALTVDRVALSADDLQQPLSWYEHEYPAALTPADVEGLAAALNDTSTADTRAAELVALAALAEQHNLALVCTPHAAPCFPPPPELTTLQPDMPPPYTSPSLRFEQPTGWRRRLAVGLALAGLGLLGLPLRFGQTPPQPAGLPLGLFTLALLVGIRAGWPGYLGAAFLWLVPNLPEFHYGTTFFSFLHAVPLLIIGLLLLAYDRRVRALWRWIWQRGST